MTKEVSLFTYVSTSELAEVLGVTTRTIQNSVEKLANVLSPVIRNSQGGYMFDERQATLIKQEIQSHHNLANRQIDSVSTELEENQTIFNALQILQRRNNELVLRAEKAEKTNELLMHSDKTYTPTQIAKELGKPVKGFTQFLHEEGYIYYQNGSWIPYHGKADFFENKQTTINDSFTVYNLHITQKGRLELLKKYKEVKNA